MSKKPYICLTRGGQWFLHFDDTIKKFESGFMIDGSNLVHIPDLMKIVEDYELSWRLCNQYDNNPRLTKLREVAADEFGEESLFTRFFDCCMHEHELMRERVIRLSGNSKPEIEAATGLLSHIIQTSPDLHPSHLIAAYDLLEHLEDGRLFREL